MLHEPTERNLQLKAVTWPDFKVAKEIRTWTY
jgi:hypothetical protein